MAECWPTMASTRSRRIEDDDNSIKLASYDPLNPEHEAIGRVYWVNSTICRICHDFPLGGSDPRVVIKK
jgi:hypothetical protein